jgi:hypothetical protein
LKHFFTLCFFILLYSTSSIESESNSDVDIIRATEIKRLRSLVEANVEVASQLHADDFQLINPRGEPYTKDQYMNGISSGQLDYIVWEPVTTIEVRLHGDAAVIRYQSKLEIVVAGEKVPLQKYWHTDSYEKRNGQWQVVWSHATAIQ